MNTARWTGWMGLVLLATSLIGASGQQAAGKRSCDLNCDGACDLADFAIFQRGFDGPPSPTATPTPRPTPTPTPTPTQTPAPTASPIPTPPPAGQRSCEWLQSQITANVDYTAPRGVYRWNQPDKGNQIEVPAGHILRASGVIIDCGAPYNVPDVGSRVGIEVAGELHGVEVRNAYRWGIKLLGSGAKVVGCYVHDCGLNNDNGSSDGILAAGTDFMISECRVEYCYAGIGATGAARGTIRDCWVFGTGWTSKNTRPFEPTGKRQENSDGIHLQSAHLGTKNVSVINCVVLYAGDDGCSLSHSTNPMADGVVVLWTGYSPHTRTIPTWADENGARPEGDGTGFKCNEDAWPLTNAVIQNCIAAWSKYRSCDLRNGSGTRTVAGCVFHAGLQGDISCGTGGMRMISDTVAKRWHSNCPGGTNNNRSPQYVDDSAWHPVFDDSQTVAQNVDRVRTEMKRKFQLR